MEISYVQTYLWREKHIAPLVTFRVVFGAIMLFSILRFTLNGWIYSQYIQPRFYFTFFDGIQPLGEQGMYIVFLLMGLAAAGIMAGAFYRWSTLIFFLTFTYTELLDKTNYLNHYYFVSIISFLLIWLPAHRAISVDAWRHPKLRRLTVPAWSIDILRLQLGLVYLYAGMAKLNPDWLFRAMPLKTWLPSKAGLPLIGWLFDHRWVAYFFSWFGAFYDLSIPFWLRWKRTRLIAYMTVIAFHVLTALLFQIGMFPWIMIGCTLIFFSENFHIRLWERVYHKIRIPRFPALPPFPAQTNAREQWAVSSQPTAMPRWIPALLALHLFIQILLPWRFLLYPGDLFWTEQGYRFSWRVMLMEKAGYVTFLVKEPGYPGTMEISPSDYLTPVQEKMMSTQPDMILQFAHYLKAQMKVQGLSQPEIYARSFVSLNGRSSRPFIDERVNLAAISESWQHKWWILPLEK